MKKLLLLLILVQPVMVKSQHIIKTNLMYAVRFIDSDVRFDFDLSYERRVSKLVHVSLSYSTNNELYSALIVPSFNFMGSYHPETQRFNYLQKEGARLMVKHYLTRNKIPRSMNKGFFISMCADVMYGQQISRTYSDGVYQGAKEVGSGMIYGYAFGTGWTFRIKNLVIEPQLGLGHSILNGSLGDDPGFLGLENFELPLMPSYAQLHAGWAF